jgi:putative salt-induced outer membrane protein
MALLVLTGTALAAEEEEESRAWTGSLGLSYVATSGNSDTQTLGGELKFSRTPDPWGIEFGASFTRAEQDGLTTAEQYLVRIRGDRAFSDRWTLFLATTAEQDEFAGFDMRNTVELGVSYKALLGPTHELRFDAAGTWTREDFVVGEDDDYIGAMLGLDYAYHISETASFTETLVYYPNFDDSDDWRLTSETAIQASLSSRLALKVGYVVRFENEPVPGFDDTDTKTTVSLVINL